LRRRHLSAERVVGGERFGFVGMVIVRRLYVREVLGNDPGDSRMPG